MTIEPLDPLRLPALSRLAILDPATGSYSVGNTPRGRCNMRIAFPTGAVILRTVTIDRDFMDLGVLPLDGHSQ